MELSNELASLFAKTTKKVNKDSNKTAVYGTIVAYGDAMYVKIDGSDLLTPASTTVNVNDGERVAVNIQNHSAMITGNVSSPSANSKDLDDVDNKVVQFGEVLAKKIDADEFYAEQARIDELQADNVTIKEKLTTNEANISELSADNVTINKKLTAVEADIGRLDTEKLSATSADLKYATIEELEAVNAVIYNLDTVYATIEQLNAQNAIIKNVQGDLADYKTVVAGELSAAKGWMLEGAIGDAQISDLSANKIKAGTINTALVTVASADGAIEITGDQIMVNDVTDASNPVNRVVLGKYNADAGTVEYGLLVRGADGQTIMIDGNGVHNAGITDGAVDNNKVANDANIAGSKLDINSVVTEINGATEKISSTVVQVGNKTLQVYLGEQKNILDEYGETLTSQAAQIAANEESIALKVSSQEFTSYKTTVTNSINTAKTEAINTAAEDATEKADAAQSAAISTAAKDARTKATAAQNAAISAAAKDATEKANAAQSTAISTAAADATKKANEAKEDAISSAAEDATEKANEAKNDAITTAAADATAKADAAKNSAIATAATDATTKANNAKNTAISAAATDAAAKVAQALSDAKDYTDEEITIVSKSLSTATADISVLKNQIALKVEQTDIDEAVAEVNGKFASYSTISQMNAAITAAKNSITSTVSQTYATKKELTTASGKISALETWKTEASQKITKDGIISTVGNYYAYESDLTKAENRITAAESSITQQAAEIALTVKKDNVISSINQSAESVTIQASKIKLEGLVTANNNFKILTDGSIEAVNGKFAGAINIKKNTDIIGTWNETGINIKNYLKEGTKTTLDSCFEVNTADGKSTVYIGKKEVGYCNEYGVFISPDDPRYVENDGRFRFFTEYDPEYDRTVNGLFFGNSAWLCSKVDSDYPYKFIIDDLQAKQVYAEYIYADTIDCPSLNSKLTLQSRNGIGCSVSYNDSMVIINIQVAGLTMNSNTVTTKIALPDNIMPTAGSIFVNTNVLNGAWGPCNVEAYLHFNGRNPVIRYNVGSVSNAVIVGCFTFPRSWFEIT